MRIYIGGKISGLKIEIARAKFEKAAKSFREKGHIVYNPFEFIVDETLDYYEIMEICYTYLRNADKLYLLDNWTISKGATLERNFALMRNIDIEYEE